MSDVNKLKKMGISPKIINKLVRLWQPDNAKKLLCEPCYNKLYGAAFHKIRNPATLITLVCEDCKESLRKYLEE